MNNIVFDLIKKYDVITIFRHISPDSDALSSQFGLKQWIEDEYPHKKVYALGFDKGGSLASYYPEADIVNEEEIKKSLAIILDTANADRVDDQRFKQAAYRLKIDHHIFVDAYADTEIVQDNKSATCEILASMLKEANKTLSTRCAQYLYEGIITDTLKFSIASVTPDTLLCAAYLMSFGVDVVKANEIHFSTSLKLYHFENYIRSHVQIVDDCVAYMVVYKEDYEKFGLTFQEAKEKVFVMGGVHELLSWALFTEKEKDEQGKPIFNGSLRSKYTKISDIAQKYHGGGHRLACGVKKLYLTDIEQLVQELSERVRNGYEG